MLSSVSIDTEKCRHCGVCERLCAFGVFTCVRETIKGRDKIVDINIDQDRCTGCGVCSLSCMSKAISVQGVIA